MCCLLPQKPWFLLCYSLRAQYGTDTRMNAVHASDSHEMAARELAFFFPRYKVPWVPGTEPPISRTLALIRPSALAQHRGELHCMRQQYLTLRQQYLTLRQQYLTLRQQHLTLRQQHLTLRQQHLTLVCYNMEFI